MNYYEMGPKRKHLNSTLSLTLLVSNYLLDSEWHTEDNTGYWYNAISYPYKRIKTAEKCRDICDWFQNGTSACMAYSFWKSGQWRNTCFLRSSRGNDIRSDVNIASGYIEGNL